MDLACEPIVSVVLPIKLDAAIIDKRVSAPGCIHAHGVMVVNHPVAAT